MTLTSSPTPLPTATAAWPRPGSSLHHALAATPSSRRDALTQWLSWWHEVSQIPLSVSDPSVAETKLQWWLAEIGRASQGQAQHPLIKPWQSANPPGGIRPDWPLWSEQIQGLLTFTHQTRWLDDAALRAHIEQSTGSACESAALILGAHSPAARQAARQMGLGLRQAHQLARLGLDARLGWVHVPIDVLQAHQVRAHELSKPTTVTPQGWRSLLEHLHAQARSSLENALARISTLQADERAFLRPLRVLAHIHLKQMQAIEAGADRVLHERILLTPWRKAWIAQQVRWNCLS